MTLAERPIGRGRKPIHLILASEDKAYANDLADYLRTNPVDIVLTALMNDPAQIPEVVKRWPGVILLLDSDLLPRGWQDALDTVLSAGFARVILLVSDPSAPPVKRLGLEVIFKYSLGTTLVERVRSLPTADFPDRPLEELAPAVPVSTVHPAVIAVYSPRGGAGSSTLAANLAYLYASKGRKVALVDLARHGAQHVILRQPQRGQGLSGLSTLLNQEPGAAGSERMATYLQQALQKVEQGKAQFHLLPASQPARMEQVGHEPVRLILEQLATGGFQVILVDLSSELADRARAALAVATRIVIPVLPEVVSAWHALQVRDALSGGQPIRSKLAFVINRLRPDSGFDPREFIRLGGTPLLGTIPDEYREVAQDLAAGRLTAIRQTSPYTRALKRVAHALYPVFEPDELTRRRWLWSRS